MANGKQIKGGELAGEQAEKLHHELGGKLTEWLKLRTGAIEQKVDLRMDGLEKQLLAKLDNKPGLGAMIINSVVMLGVLLAILSYAADRFNGGMSATGALAQQEVERKQRDADLDKQLQEIKKQLDSLQKKDGE